MQILSPASKSSPTVVLVHGLNLNPDKLLPLANSLNQRGIGVINLHLKGVSSFEDFKSVTYQEWQKEFRDGVLKAKEMSNLVGSIGYSLGGLLATDYSSQTDHELDYLGLICPAVSLRVWTNSVRLLFGLKGLSIPSASDGPYTQHRYTPVNAYKALFDIHDGLHRRGLRKAKSNMPKSGRVVVASGDELVSTQKIKKLFSGDELPNYPVSEVPILRDGRRVRMNHIVIDRVSMGGLFDKMVDSFASDLELIQG